MNWLDVVIVLFLVATVIRGFEVGFIRQFFSTAGFFGGLFLGAWAQGKFIHLAHSVDMRAFIALAFTITCALLLMGIGEYVGWMLKFKVKDTPWANRIDRFFGSGLAIVALVAALWMGAAVLRTLPNKDFQKTIRTSRIISAIESNAPSAPDVLTKVGRLIDPNGFPQVFTGLEPYIKNDTPLPDMGDMTPVVQASRTSVVKIEGRGCGGIVEGSGFVAADGYVVTNAHVVAGVASPFIIDSGGSHRATAVLFDPNLDVAVLRATGLTGTPLSLHADAMASGTSAVALGYPGGGDFTASPAAIIDRFTATGRNIYNQGQTNRDVYGIKADIVEGNSGGPLIAKDGSVVGVIFARSTTYSQVGYALTMHDVIDDVNQAKQRTTAVNTGSCTD
jgi:S1-C subfamily serine protease